MEKLNNIDGVNVVITNDDTRELLILTISKNKITKKVFNKITSNIEKEYVISEFGGHKCMDETIEYVRIIFEKDKNNHHTRRFEIQTETYSEKALNWWYDEIGNQFLHGSIDPNENVNYSKTNHEINKKYILENDVEICVQIKHRFAISSLKEKYYLFENKFDDGE